LLSKYWSYWWLLIKDPDRLQSELFLTRVRRTSESNTKELQKLLGGLVSKLEKQAPQLLPEAEQVQAKVVANTEFNDALLEALRHGASAQYEFVPAVPYPTTPPPRRPTKK